VIAAIVVVVATLAVATAALHHVLFRRPLPRTRGTITVDGITAPVRIVRDRQGVPHIDAQSMEDAAFAMGFVHAQDRGWQLELLRRMATGRLSEVVGKDALEADRFIRRLGFMRVAVEEEGQLEGEGRSMLDAYSAGINAVFSGSQSRPIELVLLRVRPEPWRPAHSLAISRGFALGLALNMDMELQRLRLLQAVGAERAAALDFAYPDANPTILAETVSAAPAPAGAVVRAMFDEAARWLPTGAFAAASNNWVVDGTLTATGRPMLCNDPHLPALVPSIWYEAHVSAGGDFESAGITTPGFPFPVIGHNRRIAWGFTNSFADVQDLVIEEFQDSTCRRYRIQRKGLRDSRIHVEKIAVKGSEPVVEEVIETRHGPVLELFEVDGKTRGLALQWATLKPGARVDRLLDLQRATDWDSFRAALNDIELAPQNAVYADVDGHIGYFLAGRVPVRRGPASRLPVTGWDRDATFVRFLSVDEKPQVLDPRSHLVVTANNRVVGSSFPHHIAFDYMNGYRALRIEQMLRGRVGIDAAYMAEVQLDVVCPPARDAAHLLAGVSCKGLAEEARRGLVEWDGVMDPAAAEPCVYEAFMRRLAQAVFEPLCGDAWPLAAGELTHPFFGFCGNLIGRQTPWLLERWARGDDSVLGGRTWPEVARRALEEAVTDLGRLAGRPSRWYWGRLHVMPLVHPLGRRPPLGLLLNAGRVEVGGDTDTVLQTAYVPGEPYQTRAWAPSWRQILDVGAWDRCTGVHLPGQSGHPGSRHYRDLVEAWRRNQQHPLYWSPEAVAAAAEGQLLLVPVPRAAASGMPGEESQAA